MGQAIQPPPAQRVALSEYFELAEQSLEKLEYIDGEIISMAGGNESHSLITVNVMAAMHGKMKGKPCRVYDSNLRVRPDKTKRYFYPDSLVVCGERKFDELDPRRITVNNPTFVVEVMSASTRRYDLGKKFDSYLQCESLKEYVVIEQDIARVRTFFRHDDGTWLLSFFNGLEAVARLRSLEINLPLSEIYANVIFPPIAEDEI